MSPDLNNCKWGELDTKKLFYAYEKNSKKWNLIAGMFEGRTDNFIKNKFFSKVRKTLRVLIKYSRFKFQKTSTFLINKIKPIVLTEFLDSKLEAEVRGKRIEFSVIHLFQKYVFLKSILEVVENSAKDEILIQTCIDFLININEHYVNDKKGVKQLIKIRKKKGFINILKGSGLSFKSTVQLLPRKDIPLTQHTMNLEERKEKSFEFNEESNFNDKVAKMDIIISDLKKIKDLNLESTRTRTLGLLEELKSNLDNTKMIIEGRPTITRPTIESSKYPSNNLIKQSDKLNHQDQVEFFVPKPIYKSTETFFNSKKQQSREVLLSNSPVSMKIPHQNTAINSDKRILTCNYILLKPKNGAVELYQNLLQFKLRHQRPNQGSVFSFFKNNNHNGLSNSQWKINSTESQFII